MGNQDEDPMLMREEWRQRWEHERELNKATAEFERLLLWGVGLLNAAALGVMIESTKETSNALSHAQGIAVVCWLAGVFAAGLALISGYICQMKIGIWARLRRQEAKARVDAFSGVEFRLPSSKREERNPPASYAALAECYGDDAVEQLKYAQKDKRAAQWLALLSFAFFIIGALARVTSVAQHAQ
jgi:hypothetical protein